MTTKKQRAMAAARAARRPAVVGTAVIGLPIVRSAWDSGLTSTGALTNMTTWKSFFENVVTNFTGWDFNQRKLDGARLLETYIPILAYIGARRLGVGKTFNAAVRFLKVKF